jgi:hypothetical protein
MRSWGAPVRVAAAINPVVVPDKGHHVQPNH